MVNIAANVRKIRRTVYGRDMRKPIADSLEGLSSSYLIDEMLDHDFIEESLDHDFINEKIREMHEYKEAQIERTDAQESRLRTMENRHSERVIIIRYSELQKEIDWIEVIEHIVHNRATMYRMNGNSNISVSLIQNKDYKATDSGSSVSLISGKDYKMNAGSNWVLGSPVDDTTHIEYEYIIHWLPDYRLSFTRMNDNNE